MDRSRRRLARARRLAARRSQCARRRRSPWAQSARRDDVRDPRAVQSHRTHAALRGRGDRRGDRARRRGDGGSESGRGKRRRATARRRPHRGHRSPRRGGARAEHRFRVANDARPPVGADEGSGEPRRQNRARGRRIEMDHRRGSACRWPPLARTRLRDPHRASVPSIRTIRSSPCARSPRRASRAASSSIAMRETPRRARVLADDNVLMVTAGARNPAWRSRRRSPCASRRQRSRRPSRIDAHARRARDQRASRRGGREAQWRAARRAAGRRSAALLRSVPPRRSGARHRRVSFCARASFRSDRSRGARGDAHWRRPAHRRSRRCNQAS